MKKWWLIIALCLSVGLNVGIFATMLVQRRPADRPIEMRPRMPGGRPVEMLADRLELEGDDRQQFIRAQSELFRSVQTQRREIERLRHRLRQEMVAPNPDRAAVEEALGAISTAQTGLDRIFVDNVLMTRELLGPRQERLYFHFLERLRRQAEMGRRPTDLGRRQ